MPQRFGSLLLLVVANTSMLLPTLNYLSVIGESPPGSLSEILSKQYWSFGGRDLVGYWLYSEAGNPQLEGAFAGGTTQAAEVFLKLPFDIYPSGYLGMASIPSLYAENSSADMSELRSYKVEPFLDIVECTLPTGRTICQLSVYLFDINSVQKIHVLQVGPGHIALVDRKVY